MVAGDRLELAADALAESDPAGTEVVLDLLEHLRRVAPAHVDQRVVLGDRAVEIDDDQPRVPTHFATFLASCPTAISW